MICIFNEAASPPLCLHGNRYPAYIRELKRGECLYHAQKKKRKRKRKRNKYMYNNFLAINTFYQKNVCLIKAIVVLR